MANKKRKVRELAQIFDDDDEDEEGDVTSSPRARKQQGEEYSDEEDDLDDFIVDDIPNHQQEDQSHQERTLRRQYEDRQRKKRQGSGAEASGKLMAELGFSGADWNAVYDMFGDGTDYAYALKQNKTGANDEYYDEDDEMATGNEVTGPKRIEDVYEPAEVEEKMFTDRDEEIRLTDLPERFQLSESFSERDVMEFELDRESEWIGMHLIQHRQNPHSSGSSASTSAVPSSLKYAIGHVLKLIRKDHLEVPFIQRHRRDKFHPHLTPADLFFVHDQNSRWEHLIQRKMALKQWNGAIPEVDRYLELVDDERAIRDLSEWLGVRYKREMEDWKRSQESLKENDTEDGEGDEETTRKLKRPIRRDVYMLAKDANMTEFAKRFTISSEEFANNVESSVKTDSPDDPPMDPRALAEQYTCPEFPSPDSVMHATRTMLSQEVATELKVRKSFRQYFYQNAWVSTQPTERGRVEVDEGHEYYPFKYLKKKPVREFLVASSGGGGGEMDGLTQFLLIHKASEDGLLTYDIGVDMRTVVSYYQTYYQSDAYSSHSIKWNQERSQILQMVFDHLVPMARRGCTEWLVEKAWESVLDRCRGTFERRVRMAPPRPEDEDGDVGDVNDIPRVLSVTCGGGQFDTASFGVLLNSDEMVVDHIKLSAIHARNRDAKEADIQKLRRFVEEECCTLVEVEVEAEQRKKDKRGVVLSTKVTKHRRQVKRLVDIVAVSGWGVPTRALYEDVRRVIEDVHYKLCKDYQAEYPATEELSATSEHVELKKPTDIIYKPRVVYGRDDVARLYQTSKRSSQEFPLFPPLLKYAICVARCIQEPLFEYSALFNTEKEVLYMPLHPQQELVPQEKLYAALERVMINIVNERGVDINQCLTNQMAAAPLQFVCGLGPRKAGLLLQKIRSKGGILDNRAALVAELGLGPCVFMNCASFIRIDEESFAKSRRVGDADPLDSTRVHPEDYKLARNMAADAIEIEFDENDPYSESVTRFYEAKNGREELIDLDLEAWARKIQEETGEPVSMRLEMIRKELLDPYKDMRVPFLPVSVEELFVMLTGERDLHSGAIVVGRVAKVREPKAFVALDSGIEGVINDVMGVREGETVQCRVLGVNRERFQVDLAQIHDPSRTLGGYRQRDKFFDMDAEARDAKLIQEAKNKPQHQNLRRTIQHPLFRNFMYKEAEDFLKLKQPGDCVFRPSSHGRDQLVLTWKVSDGIFQHFEIKEEQKDNEFALGRLLKIGDVTFSDLDEIVTFFVDPMAKFVRDALGHVKFRLGAKEELEQYVSREMMANPKRIPYVFGLSRNPPGRLHLIYQLGTNRMAQSEFITITNKGYKFRGMIYNDLTALIAAFKKSPFGNAPGAVPGGQPGQQPSGPGQMRSGMGMPMGGPPGGYGHGGPGRHHQPPPQQVPYGMPAPYPQHQRPPMMPPQGYRPHPQAGYAQHPSHPPQPYPGMRPPMPPQGMPQPYPQQPPQSYYGRR